MNFGMKVRMLQDEVGLDVSSKDLLRQAWKHDASNLVLFARVGGADTGKQRLERPPGQRSIIMRLTSSVP